MKVPNLNLKSSAFLSCEKRKFYTGVLILTQHYWRECIDWRGGVVGWSQTQTTISWRTNIQKDVVSQYVEGFCCNSDQFLKAVLPTNQLRMKRDAFCRAKKEVITEETARICIWFDQILKAFDELVHFSVFCTNWLRIKCCVFWRKYQGEKCLQRKLGKNLFCCCAKVFAPATHRQTCIKIWLL